MNSRFKQWDFVKINIPDGAINGIICSTSNLNILWADGLFTTTFNLIDSLQEGNRFNVEKALELHFNEEPINYLEKPKIDNLTYVEILNWTKQNGQH